MKQSAVGWIIDQLFELRNPTLNQIEIVKKAREMEKQQERMYSEEDMRGMYNKSCGLIGLGLLDNQTENNSRFKELLEQFKKK